MCATFKRSMRKWLSDQCGISALEFVVIAPLMLTMVLGVYDVGNAIQQSIELRQAVRAGGQYALAFPDALDIPSKISAAITDVPANTPTVSGVTCSCVDKTTGAPTADVP